MNETANVYCVIVRVKKSWDQR